MGHVGCIFCRCRLGWLGLHQVSTCWQQVPHQRHIQGSLPPGDAKKEKGSMATQCHFPSSNLAVNYMRMKITNCHFAQDPSPSHHFPPGSKQFFSELLRQGLLVGCLSRASGEEGLLGARSGSLLVPIYKGSKNTLTLILCVYNPY